MDHDRPPLGLFVALIGAAVLALSVFAPWYGVSITPSGVAAAKLELATVAKQYGNATLQAQANHIGAQFHSLEGRQLTTANAHQTMKHLSLILLVLAGLAFLASLLRLADTRGTLYASGGQIALAGGLAALVVLFRVFWRPHAALDFVSLTPTWGVWLALVSAAAVFAGGLHAKATQVPWHHARPKHGPGPPLARLPR